MGLLTSKSIDELRIREEERSRHAATLHLETPSTNTPNNPDVGSTRRSFFGKIGIALAAGGFVAVRSGCAGAILDILSENEEKNTDPEAQTEETTAYYATREELETKREQFLKALEAFKDVNDETQRLFEIASKLTNFSLTTEPLQTAIDCAAGPADTIQIMFGKVADEKAGHLPPIFTKRISPTDQSVVISEEITSPEWLAIFGYGALYQLLRQKELDACGQNENCGLETAAEIGYGMGELQCALLAHWKNVAYQKLVEDAVIKRANCEEGEDFSLIKLDISEFPPAGESTEANEQRQTTIFACLILELARNAEREADNESQNQ